MSIEKLDRRRFHELTAAAFTGLVAGTAAGCSRSPETPEKPGAGPPSTAAGEKHGCRGLNECKGQGTAGKNDCRGQGDCATFASHSCSGQNQCKAQGGCGESPGLNDCKGQGSCSIPLMPAAWTLVRERNEKQWKEANKQFKDAPKKTAS